MYRELHHDFDTKVRRWVDRDFAMIPTGLIAQAHRAAEEGLCLADGTHCGDVLELVGSPNRECPHCGHKAGLDEFQADLPEDEDLFARCPECSEDFEDEYDLSQAYPEYAYPAAWGWMAQATDDEWVKDHVSEITSLGFYVYNGDFGHLLGIDAGGFDFFEAYWAPLYRLRFDLPDWYGRALVPTKDSILSRGEKTSCGWKLLGKLRVLDFDRQTDRITIENEHGKPTEVSKKDLSPGWVPVTNEEWDENGMRFDYQQGDRLYNFIDEVTTELRYVTSVDGTEIILGKEPGTLDELKARGVGWDMAIRDDLVSGGWYVDPNGRKA